MPDFAAYDPRGNGVRDAALVVRPARPADAEAVAAVAATRGAPGLDVAGRLPGWLGDPDRLVLVAESGGAVVGWAMVGAWGRPGARPGPHVSALTVHPEHRRRGAGDRLLAALTTWTWDRGEELWSIVNAGNGASLQLHRRRGFAVVEQIAEYAGVTFDGGCGVLLRAARPDGDDARPDGDEDEETP